MAVNLHPPVSLHPIAGCRLGAVEAAIKKPGRKDLLLIELAPGSRVGGVFTRNAFCAAPVQLCRQALRQGREIRALLINAGNANAGTGSTGEVDARATMAAVAAALPCAPEAVLPFSTGVIGQRLPVARMVAAIPDAVRDLASEGWLTAAHTIMTTDTVAKGASRQVQTSQGLVTVTGVAKGAGMICPDMATLLAFVGTDARLTTEAVQGCITEAAQRSFNCITVDGDTSTNDACMLFATAQLGLEDVSPDHRDYPLIAQAVTDVCTELAQAIVRDGEGATRFITIDVRGAHSEEEARKAAYALAHSPLFKTATFAGDANWGRILAAVGRSGVPGLDVSRIGIRIDEVALIERGEPHPEYQEARGAAVFARPEYTIAIDLGLGEAGVRVWTCDFSYDYVKINAEYRT